MAAKIENRAGNSLSAMADIFDTYSGPVLLLEDDAQLKALNGPGVEVVEAIGIDEGLSVMPAIIQLAVKTRTENRSRTRTFSLPASGRQIEFTMLPQRDGTQLMIGRDATLEVNIRSALAESRTRFKDLVDVAADFAWETNRDGLISYISPRGAMGYSPEELLGERPQSFLVSPESAPIPLPFSAQTTVRNVELWVRTRNGSDACILVSAVPVLGKDGLPSGTRGIAIDVTEERNRQSELARLKIRERLVAYIVDALRNEVTPTEMVHSAASALGRSTSAAACSVLVRGPKGGVLEFAGYGDGPPQELIDEIANRLTREDGAEEGAIGEFSYLAIETAYRGAANGSIILWQRGGDAVWENDESALLKAIEPQFGIVFRQISDQYVLEHLSRTDELTGLQNRRAFMEDLSREMSRYERYGSGGCLLFIDLDNFKTINDKYGHEAGDDALQAIAQILLDGTRTYDLTCRLGGDEFAVWIEGADAGIANARAEAFLSSLAAWKKAYGKNIDDFGMSIGISEFHSGLNETVEGLIARADRAMYDAKKGGKQTIVFAPGSSADG